MSKIKKLKLNKIKTKIMKIQSCYGLLLIPK